MLMSRPAAPDLPPPHPHGDFDEDKLWKVRSILEERIKSGKFQYLIDWEDDEQTGEKYPPTWEPKKNLTLDVLAEWEEEKAAKKAGKSSQSFL